MYRLLAFILLILLLCTAAHPALAKGFSSGGRSGFSSGKGFSSGSGYAGGGRSFSSRPAAAVPSTPSTAPSGGRDFLSGPAAKSGAASPSRESFSTGRESFSTPRQATPPAMYRDYSTGAQGYTTGRRSYESGRASYSGSGAPDQGKTAHPEKPPVSVSGPAPRPPEYYHDYYWSLPFLLRFFFLPHYVWTPWGYHFFAPRLLAWLVLLCLLGLLAIYLLERARRR